MKIPGYNAPRPQKKQYDNFLMLFSSGLKALDADELSFMIYGSQVRGDDNPGRSDIDGVLEFPGDVVIDKQLLRQFSTVLAYALRENPVPIQLTVSDSVTNKDGRFNSYSPEFEEYFASEGRVLVGREFYKDMCFVDNKNGTLSALNFNLRKVRGNLFAFEHMRSQDYAQMLYGFNKSLDAVSRASKQIQFLVDGRLTLNRFSSVDFISSTFSDVDFAPLERIRHLYSHLEELDALYPNSDEVRKVWEDSLTTFEQMIRAYIREVPKE